MVTAEEIRKRVETSDRARIQRRADAAEAIAAAVERRTGLRAELADLDASITQQVRDSAAVMTVDELAEFTGIPTTELGTTGRGPRGRKPARANSPRGRRATRTSARTAGAATPSATAGDDATSSPV